MYYTGAILPPLVIVGMVLELLYNSFSHVHRIEKRFGAVDSEFNSTYDFPVKGFVTWIHQELVAFFSKSY